MKIVWLSWKDKKNPQAGGAETVGHELRKRLVRDGHEVLLITAAWPSAAQEDKSEGYQILRLGNRWTVYFHTWRYYRKYLRGSVDIVIDEMNTMPFFAKFYSQRETYLFVHQLCRQVWFYEMIFPLSVLGYLLEPIYLFILRKSKVITVSHSTKNDLIKYGFLENKISIISEGIEWEPIEDIDWKQKYAEHTLVSIGSIRKMKRTDQIIRAFEMAKREIIDLRLIIAGKSNGDYGEYVFELIKEKGAEYVGVIDDETKKDLLGRSHLYVSTSIKEGWGLVVTEANSLGTPAIGYDIDGLRDSIRDGKTGIIVPDGDVEALAKGIVSFFSDLQKSRKISKAALEYSRGINFENSYYSFKRILNI